MSMRIALFCLTLVAVFMPLAAHAYIGPGLGVVAVWAVFGPVAGIASIVLILAYFPLRYLYKKRKHKKNMAAAPQEDAVKTSQIIPEDLQK